MMNNTSYELTKVDGQWKLNFIQVKKGDQVSIDGQLWDVLSFGPRVNWGEDFYLFVENPVFGKSLYSVSPSLS